MPKNSKMLRVFFIFWKTKSPSCENSLKKKTLVASCCPLLQSNLEVDWWNSVEVLITLDQRKTTNKCIIIVVYRFRLLELTLLSGPMMCKAREAKGFPLGPFSSGSNIFSSPVIFRLGSARIGYWTGASGCKTNKTNKNYIQNPYQQILDDRRGAKLVLRKWTIMYTPCKLQCPWSSASDPPQSRWTDRAASLLVFWTPARTPRSCPAPLCKLGWNRLQCTQQGKINDHLQRHRCNNPWI